MDTRELEQLSRAWVEDDLTTALKNFIIEVGRLPQHGELTVYLETAGEQVRSRPDAARDT
jgi:hypothetical protein